MTQPSLADVLSKLVAPLAASLELELWGIELAFGGRSLVRIYVEGEQGVSIEQCAELSRLVGLSLDVEDLVPGAYVLEVSSPGLERIFFTEAQLARAVGQQVEVTLLQPKAELPGRRKFRGLLQGAPEGNRGEPLPCADALPASAKGDLFVLKAEDVPGNDEFLLSFAFADLKKARQVYSVPEPVLPGKGGKKNGGQKRRQTQDGRNKAGASAPESGDLESPPPDIPGGDAGEPLGS